MTNDELTDENRRLRACIKALTTPCAPRVVRVEATAEHGKINLTVTFPQGTAADEKAMALTVGAEWARLMAPVCEVVVTEADPCVRGRPDEGER